MGQDGSPRVVMEGFMLKKKRKALQGYARRYFRLDELGSLTYAFNPHSPVRDSVSVPLAFISASRKLRTLDIDGGNSVYHCKCLSVADFDRWATAMREFINIAHNHRREQNVHAIGRRTLVAEPSSSSTAASAANPLQHASGALSAGHELDRVYAALAKLSQPICDLELVAHELGGESTQQAHTTLLQPGGGTAEAGVGAAHGVQLSTSPTQIHPSPLASAAAAGAASSGPGPSTTTGGLLSSSSGNGGSGGTGSKFRFLGKRSNSTSLHHTPAATTTSTAGLPPPTGPPLSPGLLRSPTSATSSTLSSSHNGAAAGPPRSNSAVSSSASPPVLGSGLHHRSEEQHPLSRQLDEAISALKATHAELIAAVQALPLVVPTTRPQSRDDQVDKQEELSPPAARAASPSSPPGSPTSVLARSLPYQKTHTRNAPSRATTIASSSRASFVSAVWSDKGAGGEYWYDAVPGEFVLDDDGAGAGAGGGTVVEGGPSSPPANAVPVSSKEEEEEAESAAAVTSTAALPEDEGSQADEDEDEEAIGLVAEDEDEDSGSDDEVGGGATDETVSTRHNDDDDDEAAATTAAAAAVVAAIAPQRRKVLPHPVAGDEFSMMSMLRKNIGKDLSTISFPVTMNEPISALQRLAEELEYSDLLDRAAQAPKGSPERLMLVAVFAVSGAAGNKYRSSRKPFNPLLGETYECIRPERGFRFISEKVSHHPPVLAFHSESTLRGWQLYGHVAPNQKFWGRSMEIFVLGDCAVRFLDDDPAGEYSIRKPSSFVKNLVAGTKYIEIVGDLVVACANSKAHAVVSFKEGSSWGGVGTRNKIEGRVIDERGRTEIELVGRWDDAVDKKEGKNSFTRLWQIADYPPNPERYYGFSYFATTLNETTALEAGWMAPTDSRLRPDQLALERGDVDEAERLKQVVEEKQRSKRRNGTLPLEPKWFRHRRPGGAEPEGSGQQQQDEAGLGWTYAGGYFETRDKKAFEDPDIF